MAVTDPVQTIEDLLQQYMVPAKPDVLQKLAFLLEESSNLPVERLAVLVSHDPILSAKILRMANAAFVAIPPTAHTRIVRLDQAILLLGKYQLQQLIEDLSRFSEVGSDQKFHSFWDYAGDTAVVASYLAQRLLCADPKLAYLLGLFHDMGVLILMQGMPDYLAQFHPTGYDPRQADPLKEQAMLGFDHQMVGYRLSHQLGCDMLLSRAILTHHYLEDPRYIRSDFQYNKNMLVLVVQLAETVCLRFRSIWRDDKVWVKTGEIHPFALQYLEIPKEELEDLLEDAHEKIEDLLSAHGR